MSTTKKLTAKQQAKEATKAQAIEQLRNRLTPGQRVYTVDVKRGSDTKNLQVLVAGMDTTAIGQEAGITDISHLVAEAMGEKQSSVNGSVLYNQSGWFLVNALDILLFPGETEKRLMHVGL